MTTYRDAGFLAAAFRNFLRLLGWSAGEEQEIYSLDELIEKFSLEGIHRSNAVFNFTENDPRHWTDDKAIWMNAEYIRTMPLAELLPLVKAELKSAKLWRKNTRDCSRRTVSDSALDRRSRWFADRTDPPAVFHVKGFFIQGRAYFSEDYDFDPAAVEKNLKKFPDLETWLPELADRFETIADVSSR